MVRVLQIGAGVVGSATPARGSGSSATTSASWTRTQKSCERSARRDTLRTHPEITRIRRSLLRSLRSPCPPFRYPMAKLTSCLEEALDFCGSRVIRGEANERVTVDLPGPLNQQADPCSGWRMLRWTPGIMAASH